MSLNPNEPHFWLMGVVDGDDDPVLLETGTLEECCLLEEHFMENEGYTDLYILQVVRYTTTTREGVQES